MVLPLIDFNCQNLRKFIYKLSEHVTASQRKKKMSESGVETGVPQEANARQGQMQGGDEGEIRRK